MKIKFKLNGETVTINRNPAEKLNVFLRENMLISIKDGCNNGTCALCTVLMNKVPVASCKVSLAQADNTEIITLEAFEKEKDCQDIKKAFSQAGISMCGYCDSSKIFAAWKIICTNPRPTKEESRNEISFLNCTCTETDSLVNGIYLAAAAKRARNKDSKNG